MLSRPNTSRHLRILRELWRTSLGDLERHLDATRPTDEGKRPVPLSPGATMYDEGGRTVIRFERLLRHSPERVWSWLTKADELAAWHPSPFELEPRAGARCGTCRLSTTRSATAP